MITGFAEMRDRKMPLERRRCKPKIRQIADYVIGQ
jgi:hypothetical protein